MPVRVICPSCQTSYPVDDDLRGKRVLCIHCEKPLRVPEAAVKPAPKAAPPAPETKARVQPAKPKPQAAAPLVEIDDDDEAPPPPRKSKATPAAPEPAPAKGHGLAVFGLAGCGLVGIGVVCLAAVAIVAIFVLGNRSDTPTKKEMVDNTSRKDATDTGKTDKDTKGKPPDDDDGPVAAGQLSKSVLKKVLAATVHFRVSRPGGGGQGSGFFAVENGLAITNAHVLGMLGEGADPPTKIEVTLHSGKPNSRTFTGEVVGVDRKADLALVRVTGKDLPAPLEVVPSAGLQLTQPVFIVGFPLGDSLGKDVTVSPSQVSSLRSGPDGELSQVQVNGGMHPGNSGGPVVNAKGQVVGVSVAGIKGTQLNFAVPGEHVHKFFNGSLAGVGMGHTFKAAGGAKVRFQVDVLDPLNRTQKLALTYWVGDGGPGREASGPASQRPGDSPRREVNLSHQGGVAVTDLDLPALQGNQVLWVQASLVNGAGQTQWTPAAPFTPFAALNAEDVPLSLKTAWGPRMVQLKSRNFFKVTETGQKEEKYDINMETNLVETTAATKQDKMLMFLTYRKYAVGMPVDLQAKLGKDRIGNAVKNAGKLRAVLVLDLRNRLEMNEADVSRVPNDAKVDLLSLHSQIQDSLEILSLPLPGRTVRPGEQWKEARALWVFTGDRGDLAPMIVTYTFQGTEVIKGRTQAVVSIQGVASGNLGDSLLASGRVSGRANFDVAAGQIVMAEVAANLDMEKEGSGKMSTSLVSRLDRLLGEEVLSKRGQLNEKCPKNKNNCYQIVYDVDLEKGRMYHLCLESVKNPGTPQFDARPAIIDYQTKLMTSANDKDYGSSAVMEYTAQSEGRHGIVVTTYGPEQKGDYILVVRKI